MNRSTPRAFSLIEVLIAILVLGLGLLGLGAVFPAVIAEQRRAFDSISGESIAKMVEDTMRRDTELVDLTPLRGPGLGQVSSNRGDQNNNAGRPVQINVPANYDHLWVMVRDLRIDERIDTPWSPGSPIPGPAPEEEDFLDGSWRVDSRSNMNAGILPVGVRLHPLPSSGLDPKYVWDLVARRSPAGPVEIGVFVRRIDDRIVVPFGKSLSDVLTGNNGADSRLPLAIFYEKGNPRSGRLVTDNGEDSSLYPFPLSLLAYSDDRQPTWLIFRANPNDPNLDTSIGFARRVGQKLLDNTGVVRTVVGLPQPSSSEELSGLASTAVVVSPPFTPSESSRGQTIDPTSQDLTREQRVHWVRQIVFTPQPPVAVRVFTLDKE